MNNKTENDTNIGSTLPLPIISAADDAFLPSVYRTMWIIGALGTAAFAFGLRSAVWAISFLFGVVVSLAFLKTQEMFIRKLLESRTPDTHGNKPKTPKIFWFLMLGKYIALAGAMAIMLHFELLNLVGFVIGFALLHVVMFSKVLLGRAKGNNLKKEVAASDARSSTLNA